MTDVAEIVEGLTEAQRKAVTGAAARLGSWSHDNPMQVNAGGATIALCRKGIIRSTEVQSLSGRRSRIYALTPLGISVRAHLLAKDQNHG